MFVPIGYDKVEYRVAQERMYELTAARHAFRTIIDAADAEYKRAIDEGRKLLQEFPTLSLQRRPEAK